MNTRRSVTYAEHDRRALWQPLLELGYGLQMACQTGRDPGMARHGLDFGRLLGRLSAALKALETSEIPEAGGYAREFAGQIAPYLAELRRYFFKRTAGRDLTGLSDADLGELAERLLRLGAVLGHYARQYESEQLLPEVAWIAVGRETARRERLAALPFPKESPPKGASERKRHSPLPRRKKNPAPPDGAGSRRPAPLDVVRLVQALGRAGIGARKARQLMEVAGQGGSKGSSARRSSRYGCLRDALCAVSRINTRRFWVEREDGNFEVAAVIVRFEWFKILVALRAAGDATYSSAELIACTDVPGADNIVGKLRRHPVLSRFVTFKGRRGWVDSDAPMPPEKFLRWFKGPVPQSVQPQH